MVNFNSNKRFMFQGVERGPYWMSLLDGRIVHHAVKCNWTVQIWRNLSFNSVAVMWHTLAALYLASQYHKHYTIHPLLWVPIILLRLFFKFISKLQLNGYLKSSKVRQVLADLALSQVANKRVEYLNISEKRRLAIGVQLVRDPVMLLLDEPTQALDPLSAYLLISILSNTAKKSGCGILLSLEKPRSDVFPFLDRALFLCLGGVVYSGGTRAMLEYFHGIGFPCPQLENPLMYYLCLSTVDRR